MCTVPVLVGRGLLERFVWKSVKIHAKLAFEVRLMSGIMLKQRRFAKFCRLPSGFPPLSPRTLPLRICLIKSVAPFVNRLLAISSSGLDARTNSRWL